MAVVYEWQHENGTVVETDKADVPPDNSGKWTRVFSFGLSSVNGAGGSPSRSPLSRAKASP